MVKFTILLKRNPAMTLEQFVDYHRNSHANLFRSLPEAQQYVRRYVQQHPVEGGIPGMPPRIYDGITELWFDNVAGLASLFQSKDYMEKIRPDEEKFLDLAGCQFLLSSENVVME